MNERKTETLVRNSLRRLGYYGGNIVVEEQRSDQPRIKKLLRNASKSGPGVGLPEFIIHSPDYPDFIIVIECKADPAKHESRDHNKFDEYAVDGALLYAAYLAKEFDVLAIGASGVKSREFKKSHFLCLKAAKVPIPIFSNKLLPFDNYYDGYMGNPQKFDQEYEKLLGYSKELNELLHAKKIKESQRSLLISGILIALNNPAFRASYKQFRTAKNLVRNLTTTIIDEFSASELLQAKIDNLRQAFSFIQTHATLSKDKEFTQELIAGIDERINSFIQTYEYFDAIGQFYIEFLRYANNDKGLGIVLTPPHVTELFTLLANVNKDSIVLDNTCGTAGFLISAMKLMAADAKGEKRKVDKIKKKQLVGIEYQDDIYTLATTNMVLHGDGKSNVYQGDCFDLVEEVRRGFKPTVGFLNPPYRTRKSDVEELEFVYNNLEMLQRGGVSVSIVPISCVLAQKGAGLELKERLLSKHTLEAVMSMPPELFHNSKVAVITSILVITAHMPHPPDKKTWFGYWRDDGFIKTKHLGRIDMHGRWPIIRDRWTTAFRNREVYPRESVTAIVTAEDEWCAEAYFGANYDDITSELFEQELKKYVVYQILNGGS